MSVNFTCFDNQKELEQSYQKEQKDIKDEHNKIFKKFETDKMDVNNRVFLDNVINEVVWKHFSPVVQKIVVLGKKEKIINTGIYFDIKKNKNMTVKDLKKGVSSKICNIAKDNLLVKRNLCEFHDNKKIRNIINDQKLINFIVYEK